MGPPGGTGNYGWERRTRTSTTGSRAPRPTIRRSPSDSAIVRGGSGSVKARRLQDGVLERSAGLEARHAARRDLDDLAGARVAAVALGAAAHHERPEAPEGHALALLERLEHVVDEGVERALRGHLRS